MRGKLQNKTVKVEVVAPYTLNLTLEVIAMYKSETNAVAIFVCKTLLRHDVSVRDMPDSVRP